MKQASIFPEEIPDQDVTPVLKKVRLRKRLFHYLSANGFYNYAKMVEQLRKMEEGYFIQKYKVPKQTYLGMCDAVFGHVITYQETIDSFLYRVRNEPGYSLTPVIHEKTNSRKRGKRR